MRPLRILIADDNATVRNILRQFLETEPAWSVCGEAVDGKDAVAKAVELKPDLLLLDISMPQLDGWQACKSIREQVPETKILIVTEHDPDLLRRTFSAAPVHGFLAKSEIISVLKSAVEAAINTEPRA